MKNAISAICLLFLCACQNPGTQGAFSPVPPVWQDIDFGFNGSTEVTPRVLTIYQGERLAGLKYAGDVDALLGAAREEYEIALQARRIGGNELFLGLTFPVGKESASLVLGGWGGGMCGISSVDGADASNNPYKSVHVFEPDRWYGVKLRVTKTKVRAWLEGAPLFEIDRGKAKAFSTRGEVMQTEPLGLFTFATSAQIKDVRVRKLK